MGTIIAVIALILIVGFVLALASVKIVFGSDKVSSKIASLISKDGK